MKLTLAESVMKHIANLVPLAAGLILLAVGAYSVREISSPWTEWWHHELASTSKTPAAIKEPGISDGNTKVYGVLSQLRGDAGGDDAVPANSSPTSLMDRVFTSDAGKPNHFLHRRIAVETYQIFALDVPPHAIRPQLDGTFRMATGSRNREGTGVEVLLMDEEQFVSFTGNKPWTPVLREDPSSHGEVHWDLRSTSGTQRYYLVFHKCSTQPGASLVDADFTASFE